VRIVGVGLAEPSVNRTWADQLGYAYELWSDPDAVLLGHYGALPPTETLPLRHAYLLDAAGDAVVLHPGAVSLGADPAAVLQDCETLFSATPPSTTSGDPSG